MFKDGLILREFGGIPLLVPITSRFRNGNGFLTLNETGRFIWNLLAEDSSVDELASAVVSRFDVDFARARIDVQTFLDEISSPAYESSGTMMENDSGSGIVLRELNRNAAKRRQPASGIFELTSRCNLACPMCYVSHLANDFEVRNKELPPSKWLSLAHEAVDNGMIFLLLTGGEVFLRPDFFEIYEPLTRLGVILSIYTNGTLITDTHARRLAQAPPNIIEITLYGATASTYEGVSGVPGSYKQCCAGIEALLNHGISVGLKTMVTRQNVNELELMRQMAREWGVTFSADWLLSKRRDGLFSDVDKCRLSVSHSVALEMSGSASTVDEFKTGLSEMPTNSDENFYCYAGKAAFVITSAGEMNVCLDMAMPSALPLETGFLTAWKTVQHFVDSAPPISSFCLACDVRDYCQRCPAWSFQETHTLTEPVPYLCEIAKARKKHYSS